MNTEMCELRPGVGFIPWGGHPLLDELNAMREKLCLAVERAISTAELIERTKMDLLDLSWWESKYKTALSRTSAQAIADLFKVQQRRRDHTACLAAAGDAQSQMVVTYQEVYYCLVRLVLHARWDWRRADDSPVYGPRDQSGYILGLGLSYNQWRILRQNLVALQDEYKHAQELAGELSAKINKASLPVGDEPISDEFYQTFAWLGDQAVVERWKQDLKVQDPEPLSLKGKGAC